MHVCAWLNATNQAGWLYVARFFSSLLSHCVSKDVWLQVSMKAFLRTHRMYHPWKGKNVLFHNWRENQVNGDSTRTKKLKLHTAMIKWLCHLAGRVQFGSPKVQLTLQEYFPFPFSFPILCTIFVSVTLLCVIFFRFFNSPKRYFWGA